MSPSSVIAQQAIKAALNRSWEEAIEYNLAILQSNPQDIDSLNRLARAYTELGQIASAKSAYKKVLKLDRYNGIAQKHLPKLLSAPPVLTPQSTPLPPLSQPHLFIEEPGKTKSVSLVKVTQTPLLNHLLPADTVLLVPKARTIAVTTITGTYLGCLPDDLSHRLLKLIHAGNKYSAFIRSLTPHSLTILIRETFRSKRAPGPSFSLPQSNTFSQ